MRLLVASFFPAHFPPRSGGEQRCYYLYSHLSQWHDVTLLSANYADKPVEYIEHSSSFREYRVPKPAISDSVHWELYNAGIGDECSGFVVALCGAVEGVLKTRFRELVQYADVVVHETPFTFGFDETAHSDTKPRIYASHNVEHRLAAQMLRGRVGEGAARFIRFLESRLVARADLVFATCREEADNFAADFDIDRSKLRLAPNGFEPWGEPGDGTQPAEAATDPVPYAVFIGSGHPPNVEAARFICERLAPRVAQMRFRIMGAVCSKLGVCSSPNVELLGFVEEHEMRRQLRGCAAALNPLFSGAGTNLKMLQYMEAAAPIISTAIGARGLDLRPGIDFVMLDAEEFAEELVRVAGDPDRLRSIGRAAQDKAHAAYSWQHIAARYSKDLQALPHTVSRGARPMLLHVNDHPVLARAGGGQVRIYELLREVAVDFDVQLLCLGDRPEAYDARIGQGVWKRAYPKTREHRKAEERANAGQVVSVSDIVAAEWVVRNEAFMAAFRAALPQAAGVVFEHPYLQPLAELLPEHIPVVYASQNVETDLKEALLRARADGAGWSQRAAELERKLCERANAIVAVCEADGNVFRARYPGKRILVVENGVSPPARDTGAGAEKSAAPRSGAVFLGSAHPPNTAAARFIIDRLAPVLPAIQFHLIGSVCQAVERFPRPGNVTLHGLVTDAEKARIQRSCAIGINPMADGGGSSLKVPDLMSAGLPLLSTAIGARGFGLRPGLDFEQAELDEFAERLQGLVADADRRSKLARTGRSAVRRLEWPKVGARYRRFLRALVRRRPGDKVRLLVATYRLQHPAPGGAESYLNEVLARLGERDDVSIDVAACDVGSIRDHWHFSASYGAPQGTPSYPRGAERVVRFPIDPPQADAFAKCRRLHSLWMEESCAQWERLFDGTGAPLLLGGWNQPERSGEAAWRWTSLRAQIGVPEGCRALRVEGNVQGSRRLSLRSGGGPIAETTVSGYFSFDAPISGAPGILELLVDEALAPADDPRELGVAVQRVALERPEGWVDIDIGTDSEKRLRRVDAQAWIESLIEVTEDRDETIDDLFIEVRGPHSAEMAAWLEDHLHEYDAVIVQGTPFAPIAWVPPIARSRGVAVALMPHYHAEDRYYHWKRYYEAFRNADSVLVSPKSIKRRFFDRIGAAGDVVPGGGLDLGEFSREALQAGLEQFQKLHTGERPYALVLGRKAGGKRYDLVLEAAAMEDASFDIVMVGPDDDGFPVGGQHVHYYGPRSRDFILGALAGCTCLVNMSESESFGIVLLESWAAGRPVVVQRRCLAFTELVADGENGFLVETPTQIRDAVNRYIVDPHLARRHGEVGRRLAHGFSWEAVASRAHAAIVRKMLRGERMATRIAFGTNLDASEFASGAAAETLRQLERREIHDADFSAFRCWPAGSVRCVLDIGANRGQSAASLQAAFPDATIHCFEANPLFFPVLDEVAAAIGTRCRIHHYGLGRRGGEFSLFVPWAGGRPWLEESSTRLDYYELPWVADKFDQRGELQLQEVKAQIREGDALGLDPQVVKIDVEGAENEVILGLAETIRKCRPVLLVENSDWHHVTQTLAEMGYRPFRWEPGSGKLVEFHGATTNTFYLHSVAHAGLCAAIQGQASFA